MDKDYRNFFTWVFLLIISALNFYMYWFYGVLSFILSLFFYFILYYILLVLYRKLLKKENKPIIETFLSFCFYIGLFMSLIIVFIGSLSIRYNEFKPYWVTSHTITDWEKEVVFQWMMHIWSENFYEEVALEIEKYKKDGYVLFYEWVKPWTKESQDTFNQAVWFDILGDLYFKVSDLIWLELQNNLDFLSLENNLDYNVDLSLDEIVEIYNNISPENKKTPDLSIDVDAFYNQIDTFLDNSKPWEIKVLRYVIRWFFNYMLAFSGQDISEISKEISILDIILNERDKVLSDEILFSEHNKIYIIYWDAHFDWVFANLKEKNPKWRVRIVSKKYPLK